MTGHVFVDSNIWIYFLTKGDRQKQVKVAQWLDSLLTKPRISGQVIREIGNVMLRKTYAEEEKIIDTVNKLYSSCVVLPDKMSTFLRASQLRKEIFVSYWDSLIVASALEGGCKILLSEDMQHGAVIRGELKIINPLMESSGMDSIK